MDKSRNRLRSCLRLLSLALKPVFGEGFSNAESIFTGRAEGADPRCVISGFRRL
jgi:hypothetical protein